MASLVLAPSAVLIWVTAVAVWRRGATPGARPFALFLAAAGEWAAMSALEHAVTPVATKVLLARLEYPGIVSVAPLWLTFALAYTGIRLRRRHALLWVVPAATVALAATNGWHTLVWTSIAPSGTAPGAPLVYGHGAAFWAAAAYSYALNLAGAILLLRGIVRFPPPYRTQTVALVLGLALPWAGNAIYLAGRSPLGGADPTPIAFGVTGALYAWGLFRLRLFDLAPVARHVLVEQMADAVLVLDARNRIIDVNASARVALPVAAVGARIEDAFAAWPDLLARFRDVRETQAEVEIGDGEPRRAFDVSISALHDDAGRFRGRLLVLRDVTAHRRATERSRLQALALDEAGNAIFIAAPDGRLRWVNRVFTELTGLEPHEVVGRPWRPARAGAHDEPRRSAAEDAGLDAMWEAARDGRLWRGEITAPRKDGRLYVVDQTVAPVHDPTGRVTHVIGIMQDVTARRAAERLRRDLTRAFVHDLRNPLANIRTSLDLLAPGRTRPVSMTPETVLDIARTSATRMWSVLDAVLDISRLETGEMPLQREPTDLRGLVSEVLQLQVPLAVQRKLTLVDTVAAGLPWVDVDPRLVGRVLQNLVDNAIRFTPEGGTIRVAARSVADAGHVLVSVSDTGPGLPMGFEPFQRAVAGRRPGGGSTGLGLMFCRLAVEAHGGTIRTEPGGRGATFTFSVPLAAPTAT